MKRVLSIALVFCIAISMATFMVSAAQVDEPHITDAVIISDTEMVIEFSDKIELTPPTYGTWVINYLDNAGERIGRIPVSADFVSSDLKKVHITSANLLDIFNKTGNYATYADATIAVGVDSMAGQWNGAYAEGIEHVHPAGHTSDCIKPTKWFGASAGRNLVDGTPLLGGEGLWCAYTTDVTVNPNYYTSPASTFKLVGATATSDTQVAVEFSENVTVESPWTVTYGVAYMNNDGTEAARFVFSALVSDRNPKYLVLTLADAALQPGNTGSVDEIMAQTGALASYAGKEIKVFIEEVNDGAIEYGKISKIRGTSGDLLPADRIKLTGNEIAHAGIVKDHDFVIPVPPLSTLPDVGAPRIEKVTAVNDKVIVIDFNEPVTYLPPYAYMAIRYVNSNHEMQFDNGTPLQFDGSGVVSFDRTSVIWTLSDTGLLGGAKTIADILEHKGDLAKYSDYYPVFCIEEIRADGAGDADDLIDTIVNDANVKVNANYPSADGYDKNYTTIDVDPTYPIPVITKLVPLPEVDGPRIERVIAASDNTIVVEYSEPVTYIYPYAYMAIRYVDKDYNLQFDNGVPLQFDGSALVSKDRKSVVWKLAKTGLLGGATTITDILEHKGDLEKYADFFPVFCVEEIRADGKGDANNGIETVVNDKNVKVNANFPSAEGYDKTYMAIDVDFTIKIPYTADGMNIGLVCTVGALALVAGGCVIVLKKRKSF